MDFTLLASFDSFIEAHMVFGRMEEEGINCWLKDENIVTINPVLANAVGGIKLMVANNQVEKAVEILKQIEEHKKQFYSCPYCGSKNIELINTPRKAVNWVSSIFTWLLGSYAIGIEQIWHCFNCSKEFKQPNELKNEQEHNEE